MFKATDSVLTYNPNPPSHPSTPRSTQKYTNLLYLLQNSHPESQDLQTFQEFKEAVNRFDFEKNQLFQGKGTQMMRPKYSLDVGMGMGIGMGVSVGVQGRNGGFRGRKSQSLDLPVGGGGDFLGAPESVNFLGIIKQQLHSRGSTKRTTIQQKHNLTAGLDLAYKLNQPQPFPNPFPQPPSPHSIHKSSAHSSRSFNGNSQINQYQIKQKLGSGGFSTVHLCVDVHTGQKYAMKVVKKKEMRKKIFRKNSVALVQNFINNQIAIVKKIEHPYIIKLYEVIEDEEKNQIYMIFQYCQGGFINQIKKSGELKTAPGAVYKKLLQSECRRYYKQLSLALDYIHNVAKIAHRDIKPQNILLSEKDEVKVSDFGLGTEDLEVSSRSGTMGYLPPQARNKSLLATVVNSRFIAQMADIWALGITLLVLLQGKTIQIQDDKLQPYINSLKQISPQCKDLLKSCLQLDPQKRITADKLVDHPWIQAKKPQSYPEIQITKQEEEQAIVKMHRDILKEIARINME